MLSNNEKIIEGIAHKNYNVIKSFIDENFKSMCTFVEYKGGTEVDAEDLMQDAMMVLYNIITNKKDIIKEDVNDYFFGIYNRLWQRRFRVQKNDISNEIKVVIYYDIIDEDADIDEHINNNERYNLYNKYINRLTKECKELFNYIFSGLSVMEAAKKLKYSIDFLYKKRSMCKKQLLENIKFDNIFNEIKF